MSKFFKGDVTNGVVEFNLLDPAVGAGGTTATVVTKNTGANEVLKVVGDIPASYASTDISKRCFSISFRPYSVAIAEIASLC